MITWPKATLVITGTCAALLCGLTGCNKAPSQNAAAPQAGGTAGSSATPTGALAAGLQEPPLEAPIHGNNPEVAAMSEKYVQWIVDKAMPAGLHKPTFPDPNRRDGAALLQRYKYALWGIAEVKVATAAAVKQLDKFYGPAPKGNYGKMAEGLPQLPADKK